jgi:hypothetical protein
MHWSGKKFNKPIELYEKSVQLGNSFKMNNLVLCFEDGGGVEKTEFTEIELLQQSIQLGNS